MDDTYLSLEEFLRSPLTPRTSLTVPTEVIGITGYYWIITEPTKIPIWAGSSVLPEILQDISSAPAYILPDNTGITGTGIIIPSYIYPDNGSYDNQYYNNLMTLVEKYPNVPIIVILNPNTGPGTSENSDYTTTITRLISGGITPVGYVATGNGLSGSAEVQSEIDDWVSFYPNIQGIFFDEMYTGITGAPYYSALTDYTKQKGLSITIGNPGTQISAEYLNTNCVDTAVIYEDFGYPAEEIVDSEGYSDIPYNRKAALIHSSLYKYYPLKMIRKHCGYIYATDDLYQNNPWDTYSTYLGELFRLLSSLNNVPQADNTPTYCD